LEKISQLAIENPLKRSDWWLANAF